MLKIWFISVDENIFVYFLQQFVKITLNGIVVIMPGSKIQALKTFVIPISMSSSINRRKILTLPFWRAKQKVTTFQTSPLCSACRNIPLLWKRYVSINQTAGKCCHFLFGERNRKWQHFRLHHCVPHVEISPCCENGKYQSIKRQKNAVTSCLESETGCRNFGLHHCVWHPEKPPSCENGTDQSINGRQMLSPDLWRAKQEVTAFWTSPLCLASRETPFLWIRHGSINKRQANALISSLAR